MVVTPSYCGKPCARQVFPKKRREEFLNESASGSMWSAPNQSLKPTDYRAAIGALR